MIENIIKFMTDYMEMMQNPKKYCMEKMGVPEDIANDPNKIIQKMMNDGKISQKDYDEARNDAMKLQNNPMFRQMMK